MLGADLGSDGVGSKLQRGRLVIRQVAEFVDLWDLYCHLLQHVVSVEAVERVCEIQLNDDVVKGIWLMQRRVT